MTFEPQQTVDEMSTEANLNSELWVRRYEKQITGAWKMDPKGCASYFIGLSLCAYVTLEDPQSVNDTHVRSRGSESVLPRLHGVKRELMRPARTSWASKPFQRLEDCDDRGGEIELPREPILYTSDPVTSLSTCMVLVMELLNRWTSAVYWCAAVPGKDVKDV
jgi:hypothetical protein